MPLLSSASDFWQASSKGRLAGLDVGQKTIGIAFSDPGRVIASPFKTLSRTRWKLDGSFLCDLFHQQQVQGLVIGWPLNMDGSTGPRCHATRHFVDNLLLLQDFPLILWDERLSTVAATRILRDEADLSRQKRTLLIDAVAASFILESFLATGRRA